MSEKREEEWLWWSESGRSSKESGQRVVKRRKGGIAVDRESRGT